MTLGTCSRLFVILSLAAASAGCDKTVASSERPQPQAAPAEAETTEQPQRESGGPAPRSTLGKARGAAQSVVDRAEKQSQDLAEEFDETPGGSDTTED